MSLAGIGYPERFFLPILVVLPVLVGIYVYRDAKRRGMNATAWALVSLLVPCFVGFVVYLFARGSKPNLHCPNCNTRVEEGYVVCPECAAVLQLTCPSCGGSIENSWNVCPHCAASLQDVSRNVVRPVQGKSTALWAIIALALISSALLLATMVTGMAAGSGGWAVSKLDLVAQGGELGKPSVKRLLEEWDTQLADRASEEHAPQVFVACYDVPEDVSNSTWPRVSKLLVYYPDSSADTEIDASLTDDGGLSPSRLFGKPPISLELEIGKNDSLEEMRKGNFDGYALYLVQVESASFALDANALRALGPDGQQIACNLQMLDEDPCPHNDFE